MTCTRLPSDTNLDVNEIPQRVVFRKSDAGGHTVKCVGCGLDWEETWDEGGYGAFVWTYEYDASDVDIWVRATCLGCTRVEIFSTTGGDASGYRRDDNDLQRKHREAHVAWGEREQRNRDRIKQEEGS